MSKGTIISHLGRGQYSVSVELDQKMLTARTAKITARRSAITTQLADAQSKLDEIKVRQTAAKAAVDAAITTIPEVLICEQCFAVDTCIRCAQPSCSKCTDTPEDRWKIDDGPCLYLSLEECELSLPAPTWRFGSGDCDYNSIDECVSVHPEVPSWRYGPEGTDCLYVSESQCQSENTLEKRLKAVNEAVAKLGEVSKEHRIQQQIVNNLRIEQLALIQEQETIDNSPKFVVQNLWCADYSTNLELDNVVGMIEVPGTLRVKWDLEANDPQIMGDCLIFPAYDGAQVYSATRDGTIRLSIDDNPSGVYFNWAMQPPWAKWYPRYRFATITAIDKDAETCSLDIQSASLGRIDLNYQSSYSNVPFDYMGTSCGFRAFHVDDEVVVMFIDQAMTGDLTQNWSAAKLKVIGFKHNPLPCRLVETGWLTFEDRGDGVLPYIYQVGKAPPFQSEFDKTEYAPVQYSDWDSRHRPERYSGLMRLWMQALIGADRTIDDVCPAEVVLSNALAQRNGLVRSPGGTYWHTWLNIRSHLGSVYNSIKARKLKVPTDAQDAFDSLQAWDGAMSSDAAIELETFVLSKLYDDVGTTTIGASLDGVSITTTLTVAASTFGIVTTSLSAGVVGQTYSAKVSATGGFWPYSWAVTSGSLPDGLSLASDTGVISGTPTTVGSPSFTVEATDSDSTPSTDSQSLSITIGTASTTLSIWSPSSTPATDDYGADSSIELGIQFTSQIGGTITGVRFYKSTANTGTHVASLWTQTGSLLAQATFTSESGSGWQEVSFSSPVTIYANTTYVASYHTTVGHYAADANYFATSGYDNLPLRAKIHGGVYRYSSSSAFPYFTLNSSNYWVDVVFSSGTPPALVSIEVTPAHTTVDPSDTLQFTATGTYANNVRTNITSSVSWASSITATATVVSGGLATGVASGKTSISAQLGSIIGRTVLTVPPGPTLSSIAISPEDDTILVGQTPQFTATGTYTDSSSWDITANVSWTSTVHGAATISAGGLATGISSGAETVTLIPEFTTELDDMMIPGWDTMPWGFCWRYQKRGETDENTCGAVWTVWHESDAGTPPNLTYFYQFRRAMLDITFTDEVPAATFEYTEMDRTEFNSYRGPNRVYWADLTTVNEWFTPSWQIYGGSGDELVPVPVLSWYGSDGDLHELNFYRNAEVLLQFYEDGSVNRRVYCGFDLNGVEIAPADDWAGYTCAHYDPATYCNQSVVQSLVISDVPGVSWVIVLDQAGGYAGDPISQPGFLSCITDTRQTTGSHEHMEDVFDWIGFKGVDWFYDLKKFPATGFIPADPPTELAFQPAICGYFVVAESFGDNLGDAFNASGYAQLGRLIGAI